MNNLFYKIILSVIISFTICTAFAQQEYNKTDTNGLKQGKWVKMWDNGVVRYKGQFKDDKPYGKFLYYYPSGKLKSEVVYSDNGRKAANITYYQNGKKMAEGEYYDEKKEGIWKFYNETGSLVSVKNHKSGKLNGKAITYYVDSDQPYEILNYKDGLKDGEWIKYFPKGELMLKARYVKGKLEGDFIHYSDNGTVLLKGQYKNGIKSGVWEIFDENGNLLSKEIYKNGKLVKTVNINNNN